MADAAETLFADVRRGFPGGSGVPCAFIAVNSAETTATNTSTSEKASQEPERVFAEGIFVLIIGTARYLFCAPRKWEKLAPDVHSIL